MEEAIFTKESIIKKTDRCQNLPSPLFSKEGYCSSLWQREVRRDFTNQCLYYFQTVLLITY